MNIERDNEPPALNSSADERVFGPTYFGLVPTQREIRPVQGLTLVAIGALAIVVGVMGLLGINPLDRDHR